MITIPFPICSDCADKIGGAASGPDAPWRLTYTGEDCEAADCSCYPEPEEGDNIDSLYYTPRPHSEGA